MILGCVCRLATILIGGTKLTRQLGGACSKSSGGIVCGKSPVACCELLFLSKHVFLFSTTIAYANTDSSEYLVEKLNSLRLPCPEELNALLRGQGSLPFQTPPLLGIPLPLDPHTRFRCHAILSRSSKQIATAAIISWVSHVRAGMVSSS